MPSTPCWLAEPFVLAGPGSEGWVFGQRCGRPGIQEHPGPDYSWDAFQALFTEGRAKEMAAAGATAFVGFSFFRTFSAQAEAAERALTRRFVRFCRKHGVRTAVYISDTLNPETLRSDYPDIDAWAMRNAAGEPVCYGDEYWRLRACRNNPNWRAFITKQLRTAILDFRVDMIHFDNFVWLSEPDADCHCSVCAGKFREFLATRYTTRQRRERFGFSALEQVAPPYYPTGQHVGVFRDVLENGWDFLADKAGSPVGWQPPYRILDPLQQDWLEFRCASLAEAYAEFADFIRKLNPGVAIELNPTGINGTNNARSLGVDHDRLLRHGHFFWSEEATRAHYTQDGRLLSSIRSHRLARATDNKLLNVNQDPLALAEAMAFGNGCLGLPIAEKPENQRYIQFFHRHFRELYAAPKSAARVALWRGSQSLLLDNFGPHRAAVLCEQALIQGRRPYDLLLDQDLAQLGRYRAVMVPCMAIFTPENEARLRKYVANGGSLVLLEESGFRDARLRWRREPAFARELGLTGDYPKPPVQRCLVELPGGGRIAWLPEAQCRRYPRDVTNYEKLFGGHARHWFVPDNAAEILAALAWAASEPPEIDLNGPDTVIMETTRPAAGGVAVHLLNYRPDTRPGTLVVHVRPTLIAAPRQALLRSPDRKRPVRLALRQETDGFSFHIPDLQLYDVVQLTE